MAVDEWTETHAAKWLKCFVKRFAIQRGVNMPTIQIGVRIAVDLWKRVRIEAIKRETTPAAAVTEALTDWLKKK